MLRNSFRRSASAPTLGDVTTTDMDSNNNDPANKKKTSNTCDICGKRLLKLARWRNYFTLPCKCRHMFCKQCITGRLATRQKVLHSQSFDLMWTFPCPGHAQCGQQLTVDWSRGSSYSKNLVASDMASTEDLLDFPLEEDEGTLLEVYAEDDSQDSELDNSNAREYG